jgi:hypothetical protein
MSRPGSIKLIPPKPEREKQALEILEESNLPGCAFLFYSTELLHNLVMMPKIGNKRLDLNVSG